MADTRYRNFATVVYPESAPENWLDILRDLHIPAFISPLHDSDLTDNGKEHKKAHYHVMTMHEGKKSIDQVKEIYKTFSGVGCEVVQSLRGYARYLCHLDDPNKAQYKINQVVSLGGANYTDLIGTMADKMSCITEMVDFINENDIDSFYELVNHSRNFHSEWFDCLMNSGSYFIKEYIKSRTWKLHKVIEE